MSRARANARRLALVSLLAGAFAPAVAQAFIPTAAQALAPASARAPAGGGARALASRRAEDPARPKQAAPSADSVASARPPGIGSSSAAGPPLTNGSPATAGDEADAGAEGTLGEGDPLVGNGLGSPTCRGALGAGELPVAAREDCETSGFAAAAAPTGDFGFDVHIDTGVLGLSSGGLLTSVQDLFVTPLWMALVWAVHALVVMLEWCFTVDLIDSPSVELGVARALRALQAAFTLPWLATTFAVAAVVLAYDGLVRRRIGESLGRVMLALAMTGGGFAVMLDPSGTVGAIAAWANRASLGTLAVSARGSPSAAAGALGGGLRTVFAATVEGPWCYLEFGNVGWCRDPHRVDPRLRAAALALASEQSARIGCSSGAAPSGECVAAGGAQAIALAHSARLLRSARTNGAIFLALPANGAERNSINDSRSLLRAICQSDDATHCRGPSASEAEFRTNHGTWPRVGGLLLIVVGALGMLLLLGHLALRLLISALFSLLYLLLAPLVTLAPALGEGGRAAFRKWGVQLLAALVSKLLFSFVLGVVLAVLGILASLEALGWWTQWLLMSAFWWSAFIHRHQVLAFVGGRSEPAHGGRPTVRRVGGALGVRRRVTERVRDARERRRERRRAEERAGETRRERSTRPPASGARPVETPDERSVVFDPQVRRVVEAERRDARGAVAQTGAIAERVAAAEARLERVRGEREIAAAGGDRRRAARMAVRGERIEDELGAARGELSRARLASADEASSVGSSAEAPRERDRARFLDLQSALPAAAEAHGAGAGQRRDYAALAALAGHGPREYEQLSAREQRAARVAIDRELAFRRERLLSSPATVDAAARRAASGEERIAERRGAPVPWRESSRARPARVRTSESTVMQDARAVAERRKRQLGTGRE